MSLVLVGGEVLTGELNLGIISNAMGMIFYREITFLCSSSMSIPRSLQLYLNHLRVRNKFFLARCLTNRGGIVQ